jgi:uncharacterized protein YndB with AHSA1/START domain
MASVVITPDQDAVHVDTFIAAPPQRVFQAFTDPQQLLQWWGHGEYRTTEFRIDLCPGGSWRCAGVSADGKPFHVEGEYREVEIPKLIVYTWRKSWMPNVESLVRVEISAENSGTHVRVQHSGFASIANAARDHGTGWVRVLGWMQAFVERGETIDSRLSLTAPLG